MDFYPYCLLSSNKAILCSRISELLFPFDKVGQIRIEILQTDATFDII